LGLAFYNLHRHADALQEYRKSLDLKSDYSLAYNNLCEVLNIMGRYGDALKNCEKAAALNLEAPEMHFNLGNSYYGEHRFKLAAEELRKAIAARPDYAEAIASLCATSESMGLHDEAIAECGRAILLKPNFPEAHSNLCRAFVLLKRYGDAISECNKALALNPSSSSARRNLAAAQNALLRQQKRKFNPPHAGIKGSLSPEFSD
jgi:tetratricopeptide (TPR) repeat protein